MNEPYKDIIHLPRGGYIVDTSLGYIQFSSPPETIKDSMGLAKGVPQYFVLPEKFFNWIKGISVAEVEFPIYFNFFIKKRKTYIICSKEQYSRFQTVLQEALFGPRVLNLEQDFDLLNYPHNIPDLKAEIDYFRRDLVLTDLVQFKLFEQKQVKINQIRIKINANDSFKIVDGNKETTVPGRINYQPRYQIGQRLADPFSPPLFAVTCLGPSHGFDPKDNTSGFIIWLNHKGIMVDPPVNSTEWLQDSNVSPKFIDSIILTHCHADHDAGTFQKILEEGKIKVYSTQTVMDSFLRKYAALTHITIDYLKSLFHFIPLKISVPEYIHGGQFKFYYSLHSIPTIGFRLKFQDKTFVYSSDHNNDPILHKQLLNSHVLTKERFKELLSFPWQSDVIYHESGVAPLHTPIKVLTELPDEIKERTIVYHIAKKDFSTDRYLTLARFGIEHTLYFDVKAPVYEKTYQILGVLNFLDFSDDMPIYKAQEFLSIVEVKKFKKNDIIIRRGTAGDQFYIIYSGNVAVITDDLKQRKIYGPCDYFGEVALVTDQKRTADVVAMTDVLLYVISKDKFLSFIKNTEFEKTLLNLARTRDSETWNLLSTSSIFRILTSTQKTMLESMLRPVQVNQKSLLINEGKLIQRIFIIRQGTVEVFKNKQKVAVLGKGAMVGSMAKVYKKNRGAFSFINQQPVSLYYISKEDVVLFLEKNPGLIMKLAYDFYHE